MVVFDQLRISDDSQYLYLDAHVNQSEQFADVNISSVTVCTEDEVSELYPEQVPSKFIYQQDIHAYDTLEPLYSDVQYLSEQLVLDAHNIDGGWNITNTLPVSASTNYLSVVFSGKFEKLDSEYAPKLVVSTRLFDPLTGDIDDSEILFTIDGEHHEEKGHSTWMFKGKGEIRNVSALSFYLFKQSSEGVYTPVGLEETDDKNFLHFLWQVWSLIPGSSQKSVHLMLSKASFDGAFNNLAYDGEGKPYIDHETGEWARNDNSKPVALNSFDTLDLSSHMFFVYIETEGTPTSDVPCTLDEPVTLGVTFDYGTMFNQAMNYTKELINDCQVPQDFINYMLTYDALKLAIETDHYVPAIQFWKNLTQGSYFGNSGYSTKPCGCHG